MPIPTIMASVIMANVIIALETESGLLNKLKNKQIKNKRFPYIHD